MRSDLDLNGMTLPPDTGAGDGGRPLYSIGVVADLLGVSGQTLRLYESQGLIKPARRKGERYYSQKDLRWLHCLRRLIHEEKVSIEGVKRLLRFAPCWEIIGFREEVCCEECPVFLERNGKLPYQTVMTGGGEDDRERGRQMTLLGHLSTQIEDATSRGIKIALKHP